jgi:hypothetical protein
MKEVGVEDTRRSGCNNRGHLSNLYHHLKVLVLEAKVLIKG